MKLDNSTARFTTVAGTQYLTLDDVVTGAAYCRVAERLPSLDTQEAQAALKKLNLLNPIFADGDYRGYYVPITQLVPAEAQTFTSGQPTIDLAKVN